MITPSGFDRAAAFLRTSARPLERALFEHDFEGAPPNAAEAALGAFRNDDGGFGRALEPDSRAPDSGALATSVALRHLADLGASPDHPLVRGAARWLLDSLDPATGRWRILPEAARDFPHAPWWDQRDGALERTFEHFRLNPAGEVLALLWRFAPDASLDGPSRAFVAAVREGVAPHDVNGHLNAVAFAAEPAVPAARRAEVLAVLREVAPARVARTRSDLARYALAPLALAPTPDALLADLLRDDVEMHLDVIEETQDEDGSWAPAWSWGDAFPDVWPQAEREWRGVLTLANLRALRAWGRLPA